MHEINIMHILSNFRFSIVRITSPPIYIFFSNLYILMDLKSSDNPLEDRISLSLA